VTVRRIFVSSVSASTVRRSSSDLDLDPHFHALFLDGVYRPPHADAPVFRALPRLSTSDVAEVLQTVRARILDRRARGPPQPLCRLVARGRRQARGRGGERDVRVGLLRLRRQEIGVELEEDLSLGDAIVAVDGGSGSRAPVAVTCIAMSPRRAARVAAAARRQPGNDRAGGGDRQQRGERASRRTAPSSR
jgi:hypothetical protein